jgi:hypothetical protein
MHLSLLHPLGTLSHKVNEGGPEKENTKISTYERETMEIRNKTEKEK